MNKKLFNVRINDRKVVITFVAIALLGKYSSNVLTVFTPSEFEIFDMNYLVLSTTFGLFFF